MPATCVPWPWQSAAGRAAVDGVPPVDRATAELRVARADARVDDVRLHARTGRLVREGGAERKRTLVDAIEPPGCVRLGRERFDRRVELDGHHASVTDDAAEHACGYQPRVALERALVDLRHLNAVARRVVRRHVRRSPHGVVQDDDEPGRSLLLRGGRGNDGEKCDSCQHDGRHEDESHVNLLRMVFQRRHECTKPSAGRIPRWRHERSRPLTENLGNPSSPVLPL